jgi:hypothetical protein
MKKNTSWILWVFMSLAAVQGVGADVPPPPNAPGAVILENGTIAWTYAGRVVFRGEISTEPDRYTANIVSQEKDGRVDQLLVLTTHRWQDSIDIRGRILATDRHITCGGYDLEEVTWRDGVLFGRSRMIAGETQVLYVSEPEGFVLASASCGAQAEIISSEKSESLRRIHIRAEVSGSVDWDLRY